MGELPRGPLVEAVGGQRPAAVVLHLDVGVEWGLQDSLVQVASFQVGAWVINIYGMREPSRCSAPPSSRRLSPLARC